MPAPPTAVTVEFASDGTCVVRGELARSLATSEAPGANAVQASAPGPVTFRCALPYRELAGKPILLRVIMPPGSGPAPDTFPRLDWYREGDRVIGTATLPSAPSFVSLHRGAATGAGASFGWNFYGFFVFAAAFIAVYFGWAAWMARRARARVVA